MKIETGIKYQSWFFAPIVTDTTIIEANSEKHAYQIAYRLFRKLKKNYYHNMIFRGIITKVL